MSVRTGAGVQDWFEWLDRAEAGSGPAMAVDYELYAEGEALLGWLNATVDLDTPDPVDASALLQSMAAAMQRELAGAEIAHLKMTLSPQEALGGEVAALSLVRNDIVPELSLQLDQPVRGGQLIVNCRAETSPEALRHALEAALAAILEPFPGLSAKLVHAEQFRPGRPQPTFRFTRPEAAVATP